MASAYVTSTAYPYSSIVRIVATFGDGAVLTGSGVIVGDNDVLTASHVIADGAHGVARTVVIYPAQNGSALPFGFYAATTISYMGVDADGNGRVSEAESARDFAVLGFSVDIDNRTGKMALDPSFAGGTVRLDGYPAIYGGTTMVEDSGVVTVSGGVLQIGALDVNPGNSGGPLWVMSTTGPAVVGVVSTGVWAGAVGGTYYSTLLSWISDNNRLIGTDPSPIASGGGALVYGSAGNDRLLANSGGGNVNAAAGDDFVDGGGGNDTLLGDEGNDSVRGLDGNDLVSGGDGNDTVNGNVGADTIYGGMGLDFLMGGTDNDVIYGDDGDDVHLNGNIGADTVYGGLGNDLVFGGQNDDQLYGDGGNDTLSGDLGNDTLTSGGGADLFVFSATSGNDRITDFSFINGDRIQLPRGTVATVSSNASGAAVLSWGGDNSVTLVGVTSTQVNLSTWIVFS